MDNDSRWQRLINDGELPPPLRPTQAVYASPLRCRSLMQPDVWQAPHRAQGATFESICRRKNDLLTLGGRRWKMPANTWSHGVAC